MGTEAEQAKQLDSVTDVVQERELDASKAQEAMTALSSSQQSNTNADAASLVAVSKEDVLLIMSEMEVTEEVASRALRHSLAAVVDGDGKSPIVEALRQLVVAPP